MLKPLRVDLKARSAEVQELNHGKRGIVLDADVVVGNDPTTWRV